MSLLDLFISPAAAQAAGAPQGNPLLSLAPLVILFIVFWFLLLRPQMKRAKEHRELLSKLQKGDEVVTSGGLAGRIAELGEHFVTVEVAEKVSVRVQRGAITATLPKGTLKSA